ncbi:hypothetical protein BDN67DRAFT_960831 [Paxillus ammoniavirescens]|nr:hypothetical protein BDN67DRAFT_960831 [Paxillus ammoniavirescens]
MSNTNYDVSSQLPPEIWINIFRWATSPTAGYPAAYYEPFRPSFEKFDEPLRTKRALVQVCRRWRVLASAFLYEDVRVRYGSRSLREALVSHCDAEDEGSRGWLGRCVRRLELPYPQTSTVEPGTTQNVVQILRSCPALKTLVRPRMQGLPDSMRYEFPADIVSLSSLTRLEWWYHNDAARSGGINSLIHVLRNAPSLQFLTLGGQFWDNSIAGGPPICLPALTTLRLGRVNALFMWQICHWVLPSLIHVVVDFPPDYDGMEKLWIQFGHQLCTVELGRNIIFHRRDQIAVLFRSRLRVKILNYFIHFTTAPDESFMVEQPSLQCVGIHAFPCAMLNDTWENLNSHFDFLASRFLPALKRIVLHGDWQEIMADQRFESFKDRLAQKGCVILLAEDLTSPPCEHL